MGVLSPRFARRLAVGAGAVMVGDLVVGMASFSIISLGALWYFCIGWIRLVSEFAGAGITFGAPWQLDLAWVGAVVALPLIGLTVFLGAVALKLPGRIYRAGRDGVDTSALKLRFRAMRRRSVLRFGGKL